MCVCMLVCVLPCWRSVSAVCSTGVLMVSVSLSSSNSPLTEKTSGRATPCSLASFTHSASNSGIICAHTHACTNTHTRTQTRAHPQESQTEFSAVKINVKNLKFFYFNVRQKIQFGTPVGASVYTHIPRIKSFLSVINI